jgi:hypothetical protein
MATITALMSGMDPGEVKIDHDGMSGYFVPYFQDSTGDWNGKDEEGDCYSFGDDEFDWKYHTATKRLYKFVVVCPSVSSRPLEMNEYFETEEDVLATPLLKRQIGARVIKRLDDRYIDVEG